MMTTKLNKNIWAASLMALSGCFLTACSSEEDDIFSQSAAERLNAVSDVYAQRLASSKGGWVMEYYPYTDNEDALTGTGYLIMNRFHDNFSVFSAMKNQATRNVFRSDSSSWGVVTYMGPVLTYNSHNYCLGRFSDPDDIDLTTGRYDDESGKGFQGDYEFVMVAVPENGDHIMLKGVKRGLYQRLTRLPEGTDFESYLDDIRDFNSRILIKDTPWELVMTSGGNRYRINNIGSGCPTVYPDGSDSVAYGWHEPYLVTRYNDQYHLRFKDTIMYEGQQMEQEYAYSAEEDLFRGVIDPENVIEPELTTDQFYEKLFNQGWQFKVYRKGQDGELSEKVKTLFDAASAGMTAKSKNFAIDSLAVTIDNEHGAVWSFKYQKGASAQSVRYYYDYSTEEGGLVTFTYKEPAAVNATNIKNSVEEITPLLTDVLSHKFRITSFETRFDLMRIRFTSVTDPEVWFVLHY